MGRRRHDRADGGPLRAHEVDVVVQPAAIAIPVELAQEQGSGVVAVPSPGDAQRLEAALLRDRQVGAVGIGRLQLDIEVTDRAEATGDLAESGPVAAGAALPEALT